MTARAPRGPLSFPPVTHGEECITREARHATAE